MKPLPLSRIAQWAGGVLHGADANGHDVLIDAVVTDTRDFDASDGRAALFVALKGARFDGHQHVVDATAFGARAALVERVVDAAVPQVVVADTERALASIAAALQRTRSTRVVAITGSNGKTSVKALTLSILRRAAAAEGRVAYANPGNRNNEIGLPLSVIDAPDDAAFAIYEMGAGKPGDIAYLTAIARPHVATVNNVSAAHLERLGSVAGVADTKGAILDALPPDGVGVINADDAFAGELEARARLQASRRVIRFGLDHDSDVTARDLLIADDHSRFVLVTPLGDAGVIVPMPGRHSVANALAAAALSLGCGASLDDIVAGLADARPVAGRLVRHRLDADALLIDDSYNANPGSLDAAIDVLASAPGLGWLVLGDMRELGESGAELHAAAGRRAKAAGISRLYALGELSAFAAEAFGAGARAFNTHDTLAQALQADLAGIAADGGADDAGTPVGGAHVSVFPRSLDDPPAVRILVKGSRGSAMDRVVQALLDARHATGAANAA